MKKLLFCLGMACLMLIAGCGEESVQGEPEISVWFHEEGAVKEMKMEAYLEGVVAGEMKNDWPQEALKAQAIVARTYTLAKMAEGKLAEHNADASTDIREFQAYRAEAVNDAVKQAVQMTRGQVIEYEGAPIMAWFCASAGGKKDSATRRGHCHIYSLSCRPMKMRPKMSRNGKSSSRKTRWSARFARSVMMQRQSTPSW